MFHVNQIKHKKTVLFLLGALASLGFAPVYALPVFIAALLGCFAFLDEAKTYRQAALFGYLFGFGFFCAGFYWISNALLVDAETFWWLYPIALLSTGLFFGLFFVLPFMIWHFFDDANPWFKVLSFAAMCVLMEYVRSFLLTGFAWNMIGSMFGFSDVLIQSASLIGTYGLSFLLLLICGCCYLIAKGCYKNAGRVIIVVLLLMCSFGVWRLNSYDDCSSDLKVRLVQPSISQKVKWDEYTFEDHLNTYVKMSMADGFDDVKFVVWGETALPFNPQDYSDWSEIIKNAIPKKGYLMTGALRRNKKDKTLYNSMLVINDQTKTVQFYDKNHLVPFGEYIPFRAYLPRWVRPVANEIADFSIGEKYKVLKVEGLPDFSSLICYEIIFPDEVVNRKNKPSFVVLVSNDGWYGKSSGPYQHLVSAKLRAVEEGVSIVRAANNGISAVINPLGKNMARIGLNKAEVKDVYLPKVLTVSTLYSKVGGKGIQYVMCLLILLLLGLKNKFFINQ